MNGAGAVIWLIIAVALFVVESVTYQMVCIWFSFGAVLAMVAAWLGAPVWLQLLVFLVSSIIVLFLLRPVVKNKIRVKKSPTNADLVIGQIGVVREQVDNILQTGRVTANGLDWTARTEEDGVVIAAGERVRAVRIDGVKLIVEPVTVQEFAEKD